MADEKRAGAGLAQYLKAAFLFRWNLLIFLGSAAAAALSPLPDVLLPMVVSGELAYLAGLVSIPRFRGAIDAQSRAPATPIVRNNASRKRMNFGRKNEQVVQTRAASQATSRSRRVIVRSRPSSANSSKRPGLAVRPVTATRVA